TTTIDAGTLAATAAGALGPDNGRIVEIKPNKARSTAILDLTALHSLTNPDDIYLDSSSGGTAQLNTRMDIALANPIALIGKPNNFRVADNITQLSGGIDGPGGLTMNGPGILQLGGANNTYGGTTTINAGTLQATDDFAFSPDSAVWLADGATLNLNTF